MMERNRRCILFLAAALASTPLVVKGRSDIPRDFAAPFLPFSSTGIKVRLEGAVREPGVYVFAPGTDFVAVIKLTGKDIVADDAVLPLHFMPLSDGTILSIPSTTAKLPKKSMETMHARERALLWIPLDPDLMDRDDWLSLPGIGPALADRILSDRQKYGEFRTVQSLKRVPGIGDKKYHLIKKYFISL
jgi:competence protein ComEA